MSHKSMCFKEVTNWEWLKNNKQNVYMKRKEIVEKRILYKIHQYNGDVKIMPDNGNCLINAYLYHSKLTDDNAIGERHKLVQYMMENEDKYQLAMSANENINDYLENYKYLDEIHLKALHQMNEINILLFEYHIDIDQLSQNYYYQPSFQKNKCLFLIYYRHCNHYNYCIMPDDFEIPQHAAYHCNTTGTKYYELQILDLELDIQLNLHQFVDTDAMMSDNTVLNENNDQVNLMINILKSYQKQMNGIADMEIKLDNAQTVDILNHFLHLLKSQNNQFETITKELDTCTCDINQCVSFKRIIRERNANDARQNILDKIHCFYYHTFDLGYKLTQSEKRYIEFMADDEANSDTELLTSAVLQLNELLKWKQKRLLRRKRLNIKYTQLVTDTALDDEIEMYHFGYDFMYGFKNEYVGSDYITVLPKYASLKEEILNNPFNTLNVQQYDTQMQQTYVYFNSDYRKQTFENMPFECLFSLMIYCNYDMFQYECCKSYRIKKGMEHNNFYHTAKYLKMGVHQFGTRPLESKIDVFYRGISKCLVFPKYINGICIKCPTSTTTSFEVALNFTNADEGMILQFSGSCGFNKYMSLSWCSDFSNEAEFLFVQNSYPLELVNIIEPKCGYEHRSILDALRIFDKALCNQQTDLWCNKQTDSHFMKSIISRIVWHQLSKSFSEYESFCSLSQYARKIINIYCSNKKKIAVSSLNLPVLPSLFYLDAKWMKLKHINCMFPNLEYIIIHGTIITNSIVDHIVHHLQYFKSQLKCIEMRDISDQSELTPHDTKQMYDEAFKKLVFNISGNTTSLLIEKGNCVNDIQMMKPKFYFPWRSSPIWYEL